MAFPNFKKLKDKKKELVLNAIIEALRKHDYDDLTINDIAIEADISRGSFYNYFEDKYDAVYTLIVSRFEILKETFKNTINECNGDLFAGAIKTYYLINEYVKNKMDSTILSNIKFYMGIVTKIIYSKGYETELDDLLDWLIANTNEGKVYLTNRKKMANIMELLISLFLNTMARAITDIDSNKKYDDFNYKIEIIKQGMIGTK